MRLILLLSALLSVFAAGGAPARAGAAPMVHMSRLVDVVAARAAVATAGRRPVVDLPSARDAFAASFVAPAPGMTVPLYAGRLRT